MRSTLRECSITGKRNYVAGFISDARNITRDTRTYKHGRFETGVWRETGMLLASIKR